MNSRNPIKTQKYALFGKKDLRVKIQQKKKCRKVRDHCDDAREYRGAAHAICNLKYSDIKTISLQWIFFTISLVFYDGSNYDYSL